MPQFNVPPLSDTTRTWRPTQKADGEATGHLAGGCAILPSRRGGFLIIGWEPEDQKNDPAYKNHASCCVLMISSFEPTFSTATDLRVRVSDLSGGSTVVFNGGWPGHSCVWCIPGGLVWWRAVKRLKRDSNFVESPQRMVRSQNAIIVTGIDKRTHVKIDPTQP